MKYPKDSKFLSKIKLRVADKFKRDIDDIVEEVVQFLEEKFSMDGYIFKHHQTECQPETTNESELPCLKYEQKKWHTSVKKSLQPT